MQPAKDGYRPDSASPSLSKESKVDSLETESLISGERIVGDIDAELRMFATRLQEILLGVIKGDVQAELQSLSASYRERILFYLVESYELRGSPELIAVHFPDFIGVDRELVARCLFSLGEKGAAVVAKYLPEFQDVDSAVLLPELMRYPQIDPQFWVVHIDRFPATQHAAIVRHLIVSGHIDTLIDLVPGIAPEHHQNIAEEITVNWEQSKRLGSLPPKRLADCFVRHIDRFQGVSVEDVFSRMIKIDAEIAVSVAFNLHRFPNVDTNLIAQHLQAQIVAERTNSEVKESIVSYIQKVGSLTRNERTAILVKISPIAAGVAKQRGDPLFNDVPEVQIISEVIRQQLTALQSRPDSMFWNDLSPELDIEHLIEILDSHEFAKVDFDSLLAEVTDKQQALTAVKRSVLRQICAGSLTRGAAILKKCNLNPGDLHTEIDRQLSSLLGESAAVISAESIGRVLGIGAWSLLEPELLDHISDEGIRSRFLRYRAIFGDPSSRELDHWRRYELLERFVESGVPVLSVHGLLREENLAAIASVIPTLVREAGSAGAWVTHGRHLAVLDDCARSDRSDSEAVVRELQTLHGFYRTFHGACAPILYADFRAQLREPPISGGPVFESLLEWRSSFEMAVLSPSPQRPLTWDKRAIEYLDAWTRSRGLVQEREQWVIEFAAGVMEDLPLAPRVVSVGEDVYRKRNEAAFTSSVTRGYRAFTQIILGMQTCDRETLLSQEKAQVRGLIDQHCRKVERWLLSDRTAEVPVGVCSRQATETQRLQELSDKIERSKGIEEFLALLLQVGHRSVSPSIARLAVGEALSRLRDPTELFELLETEPSVRSLQALGEFVRNQILDETLSDLKLSTSERKLVRKALPSFDVDSVFRDNGGFNDPDTETVQEFEPIHVYPTRGVLAEFAGSFADACWTDTYDLMKRHPNAIALVFASPKRHDLAGSGGSSSRTIVTNELVGACYLLTAKDVGGDDVLIIRGLNPRERPFEHLSIESFIEGLIDKVVVPYARELGAKKVVIPFDEFGHAQTNRLRVEAYLQVKYGQMPHVPLDPKGPSTNFNDRRIFDICRLVRALP